MLPLPWHHLALEDLVGLLDRGSGREARDVPELDRVVQHAHLEVDVRRAVGPVADHARGRDAVGELLVAAEVEHQRRTVGERRVDERLGVAEALALARAAIQFHLSA